MSITVERNVTVKMRDGVTLARRHLSPEGRRQVPDACCSARLTTKRAASTLAPRPPRKATSPSFRMSAAATLPKATGTHSKRIERRLRHRGMGCVASLFQWQSWHVGRLICRRHANARRHRPSSAPGGHLPDRYRQQLSRWLDLSRRRVRTMVQRILDFRLGARHADPQIAGRH